MRVVSLDDPDKDLGIGEAGELLIRGPQVMKGYLGRPDETAAMIDPDGWLHTGDVGHVDDGGWLFVVDRVKELIKYKGFQVAPAELEALLLTHPGIADAAVVGEYNDDNNEVPHAYVVRQQTALDLSQSEVLMYVAERVAPYKRVRVVTFIDTVPEPPPARSSAGNCEAAHDPDRTYPHTCRRDPEPRRTGEQERAVGVPGGRVGGRAHGLREGRRRTRDRPHPHRQHLLRGR